MIVEDLMEIAGQENVSEGEMLSGHTTFRIGGPAKIYVTPSGLDDLIAVIRYVQKSGETYVILGNGSNLLVNDTGFDGIVIATNKKSGGKGKKAGWGLQDYEEISAEDLSLFLKSYTKSFEKITFPAHKRIILSGSGILLSALANGIAKKGLAGFEFASGIPGTLGGAVVMNAGAYGGEIRDHILGALVLSDAGEVLFLTGEEMELGYRSSRMQREKMVVLCAAFAFSEGNPDRIMEKMKELNERRREKQPLNYGSAGSTFKRPEGYFAGKLIEDAGLKGYRVGDVMVSEKHAGFVVNVGEGTCEQAKKVICHVQEEVKRQFGVSLETEVKIL